MPASSARVERIASQIQRTLALLLQRHTKDPRIGNLTVTTVLVAPDLSVARVLVLPFGVSEDRSEQAGQEALAGLRSASGFLRRELTRELRLRRSPRLEFQLDTLLERSQRLTQLIDSAVRTDAARSDGRDSEQ